MLRAMAASHQNERGGPTVTTDLGHGRKRHGRRAGAERRTPEVLLTPYRPVALVDAHGSACTAAAAARDKGGISVAHHRRFAVALLVSLLILSACTGSKSEVEMGESDDNRSETTMHETTLEVATDIAVGYTDRGDGPPVLLIHAGVFADWFVPMATEPVLDRFRVVRLRRAGYLEGRRPGHHVTLADHAAHAAAVADELGMRDAVVVGHSSGALIALELAAARPDIVASLVLFEPAPGGALAPDGVRMGIAEALNGLDVEARYDAFMAGAPDHRDVVRAALGDDGLARAIEESRWFFDDEVTAVNEWSFDTTRASSIHQPTTVIAGSNPMYRDIARRLASWLPRSTTITLDHADHLLPLRQPDVLAHLVADAVGACEVDRCPTE